MTTEVLSGKRIALLGLDDAASATMSAHFATVDAFTRSFSPKDVEPASTVLRQYELILVETGSIRGTSWEDPQPPYTVDRCIAVGPSSDLLLLAARASAPYRHFCGVPAVRDELLLRCMLAMHGAPSNGTLPASTNSTVVLADDDPSIIALVRLTLKRNGLNCEIATSGGEALAMIRRVKPCAAVLDVNMPEMDGFEILSELRNDPETARIRIMLLTGCEQESDIVKGFSLGADDYVVKPFNPMELLIRLKRLIGTL